MASFSIDDIRDTFTADIITFLERVDETAKTLRSAAILQPAPTSEEDGRPLFDVLEDVAHAIAGTTSLVGAESMASTAKKIEELAAQGQESMKQLELHAARARSIAELCMDGVAKMYSMLTLELEKRREEAIRLAEQWRSQAATLNGVDGKAAHAAPEPKVMAFSTEPPAPPPEASEFSFEDEPASVRTSPEGLDSARPERTAAGPSTPSDVEAPPAPSPSPPPGPSEVGAEARSVDDELKLIFQEEAREALVALKGHLEALAAQPDNLVTAGHIERIYHTLKGASATVGLKDVSEIAALLQNQMEGVTEEELKVTPQFLETLLRNTNHLLRSAGLPEIDLAKPEAAPAAEAPEPTKERRFFLEEARQIWKDASKLSEQLVVAGPERAGEVRTDLGRLFHRLKGSALIFGEQAVASEAAHLQSLCDESTSMPATQVLAQGITRIATLLKLEALPEPAPEAVDAGPTREEVKVAAEAELWEAFEQECAELLDNLDKAILSLEESDQPKQPLHALFRMYHTLKGAVNTIGLAPTGKTLHEVEDFLEGLLEEPVLPSMKAVTTFLLEVQAEIRKNLKQAPNGYVETNLPKLKARIGRLLAKGQLSGEPASKASAPSASAGSAGPESEVGSHSSSMAASDGADRKFIRVATERLDTLMNLAGELVVSRSRLSSRVTVMRSLHSEMNRGLKRLLDRVETFREQYEFFNLTGKKTGTDGAAFRPRPVPVRAVATVAKAESGLETEFSELELDKYEDVHVLSRGLAEISNDFNEVYGQLFRELAGFTDDSEVFGRIISDIQGEVTRSRMVPVESLFTRLRLPVRDAAARLAKDVRVVTSGEDVNVDKTIADALFPPMLHLVRNAVGHGIESALRRESMGKDPMGTITLGARQESGQIVVEVQDDGAGLDLQALHARGVAMGLIRPDVPVTDPAVKDLVFAPGLSTSTSAGAVSGRGIGCDVVRRAIERLNGDIRVETHPGRGTVFVITLPLTLAITKALLVKSGRRTYAIPLFFAERILDAEEASIVESLGVRRMKLDGGYMAVRQLDDLFGGAVSPAPRSGPVLILHLGDQRFALQVDAVLAQEEIVVKSMGDLLSGHPLFAGVTIRGNGELVLIVDVPRLVEVTAGRAAARPEAARIAEPALPAEEPMPVPVERGPGRPSEPARPAPLRPVPAREASEQKLKVLFVDDSLSVRKVAEKTLVGLGVQVTVAVDGVDGLAKLREQSFDLVFTDLEMPRMHGYELIRELRFVPAYKDLPIIVVTSRSGQKHQDQAKSLGASDYITKPFTAETLEAALKRWGPKKQGK